MTDDRRTYGDRRDSEAERLRRLEIQVAVLETTTHEIKDDVRAVLEDGRQAKNYALATLIGGFAFVVWQAIQHSH